MKRVVELDKVIDDAVVRKAKKSNQTPEEWIAYLVVRECGRQMMEGLKNAKPKR